MVDLRDPVLTPPPETHANQTDVVLLSSTISNAVSLAPEVRSEYLVNRLFGTPDYNLFNHVKFNLINDQLVKRCKQRPRILDIGCGLQVARRYLETLHPGFDYSGADYEPAFKPDSVIDLNVADAISEPMQWQPNVVMLLDVLEHLHENPGDLNEVIGNIAGALPDNCLVLITVPQLYRLDRFKMEHLHYPEHKIRLTFDEWQILLEIHFEIIETQGLGYLSVLPYLPMASRRYTPENSLGKLFTHLRNKTFEAKALKPVDLALSRTLGKADFMKTLSNDILFVARPRR
jgi:hypothetical protein